jgi:uncharacterized membrane protein YfcA
MNRENASDESSPAPRAPLAEHDHSDRAHAELLLEVKSLGFANRRLSLRSAGERAVGAAQMPMLDADGTADETPPEPALAWAAPIQVRLKVALAVLLVGAAALSLHQLSKVGAYPAALFAVFVASTVSSTVGFAFSAIAAAILIQITRDQIAVVEIMLISSIALQTYCVAALWREIAPRRVAWFLLGGLLTLPIGVYALRTFDTPAYATFIGIFLALYGVITLYRPAFSVKRAGPLSDAVVGSTGGLVGPLVAFPGAVVAIWCGMRGWDKTTQRSVYQPYILLMQIATFVALAWLGETRHIDLTYALFAVPAVCGAYLGIRIFERISDVQFRVLVNLLLIASGLGMLARALH